MHKLILTLTLSLVVMKLAGVIGWPWLVVLTPFLAFYLLLAILLVLLFTLFAWIAWVTGEGD